MGLGFLVCLTPALVLAEPPAAPAPATAPAPPPTPSDTAAAPTEPLQFAMTLGARRQRGMAPAGPLFAKPDNH